jgi:antitoxin (DNA-binding transcriptional repressor) of toxin-antitoxin stability system
LDFEAVVSTPRKNATPPKIMMRRHFLRHESPRAAQALLGVGAAVCLANVRICANVIQKAWIQLKFRPKYPILAIDSQFEVAMPSYSIAEAKNHLSKLVDEALSGEEVTITRHGKAVVELRPSAARTALRPYSEVEWRPLRARRAARPSLEDSVSIIRAMRKDF